MKRAWRKWLAGLTAAAMLFGYVPVLSGGVAEAKVASGAIAVDGIKDAAWDSVPTVAESTYAGWQGFHIDNLKLTNDDAYLYYWLDAVNVPNWGENGQFVNIALQVNDTDSGVSAAPYGVFDFSGMERKPSYHILHRVKGDTDVHSAAVYAAADLTVPVLGTETALEGAEFRVDRMQGFEGRIPLAKLGLSHGDTIRAIAVLSGNNDGEHGAFDVVPESATNPVADSWNEASAPNAMSEYGTPYTIEAFAVTIDGSREAAWDQAPLLGRSETANQFAESPSFQIDNLRLYNDGYYLYYWLDAASVPNWGENGQYVNIALNVDGQDSGIAGNPWNSQFEFGGAARPQFHIVQRIKNDAELSGAALYASTDLGTPVLATWSSLNGAQFAVNRTEGFEGRVPLAALGLSNGQQVRAIAVLSGNTSAEHGAFDVIPELAGNEVADQWNESASKNALTAYTDAYTVQGAVEELMVVGASPGIGAVNVPVGLPAVTVKFNADIAATGVGGLGISVTDATYAIAGDTLTFTLSEPLAYGTTYTVSIPAHSLTSGTFGELEKDLSFAFTTEADPLSRRYIHFYYDRPAGDYEDWNIWVWSTGVKDNQIDFTEDRGGLKFAEIAVADNSNTVGFKLRQGTVWNDDTIVDVNTDRLVTFAPGQKTAKVFVTQGVQAIRQLDHLTGPVLTDGVPTFYYRDEQLFRDNEMDTITAVKAVVVNGATTHSYDLTYDAEQEYFTGVGEQVPEGRTHYRFEVTRNGTTTLVHDAYNPNREGGNSFFEFKKPDWTLSAAFPTGAVQPGRNALLALNVSGGEQEEIREIVADLTSIGGAARTHIDPKLLKHAVVAGDSTAPGEKAIPIRMTDVYGNTVEASAVLNVAAKPAPNGKLDFEWDEARIYFVLTDRFYNGDPSNDDPHGEGYDKTHLETYHGGDFQGLIDKLDYMEALGINTLWITPIVDNIDYNVGKGASHQYQYGYHGYWAKDFTQLDEHLGDMDTFKSLIEQAHDRGIKIMVDVVVNHTGYGLKPSDTNAAGATNYPTDEDRERFAGMVRDPAGSGDLTGELAGLPDFVTEDQAVRDQIVAWQAGWLEHARTDRGDTIDYFRIDTVKHVEHTTWKALKNAAAAINPDFKMIGEYYAGSVDANGGYLVSGEMDSLLDFEFKSKARDFVNGKIDDVEQYLDTRNDKLSSTLTVGQFLSSHDEDGFLHSVGYDESKLKVAAALQMTSRGQPVVYYGEELGNSGPNANFNPILGENRKDMPWDKLEEKAGLLAHYQKLLHARAKYSQVFAKGDHAKTSGGSEAGYLVFERSYGSDRVFVGLNVTDEAKTATFQVPYPGGTVLKDEYGGGTYYVGPGNQVTVPIPAKADGGVVLLAKSGSGGSSNPPAVIVPADSHTVTVKAEDLQTVEDGKVTVNAGSGVRQVNLPITAAELTGNKPIVIRMGELTIELPASVLKQVAGTDTEGTIAFQAVPVEPSAVDELLKAHRTEGKDVQPAGQVYALRLTAVLPDGSARVVSEFGEPLALSLQLAEDADPNLSGIYYIGDDGELAYAGGMRKGKVLTAKVKHFSKYGVLTVDKSFADVGSGHWALMPIKSLAAKSVLEGVSVAAFEPGRSITRAEFAAVLARALQLEAPAASDGGFADVPPGAWYAGAVRAAAAAGIVTGRSADAFDPNATITRQEMAVMLVRAYRYAQPGRELGEAGGLTFEDAGSISDWAVDAVRDASSSGLLSGRAGNEFAPHARLTRAEAAQAVYALLERTTIEP